MHRTMVSGQRTAMVRNGVQGLRARPDAGAPILWRAEPGVVGVLSDCASSWCKFTVDGRGGYVRSEGIWGVSANETLDGGFPGDVQAGSEERRVGKGVGSRGRSR